LSYGVLVVERILTPRPSDTKVAVLQDESFQVFSREPAMSLVSSISPVTDTVFNGEQSLRLLEEMSAIARRPHTSERVRANLQDLAEYITEGRASRREFFVVFFGN
jgi:hypothetical protein